MHKTAQEASDTERQKNVSPGIGAIKTPSWFIIQKRGLAQRRESTARTHDRSAIKPTVKCALPVAQHNSAAPCSQRIFEQQTGSILSLVNNLDANHGHTLSTLSQGAPLVVYQVPSRDRTKCFARPLFRAETNTLVKFLKTQGEKSLNKIA